MGSGRRTTRRSPASTRSAPGSSRARSRSPRVSGRATYRHGVNFCGGLHHAMPERGQRLLHLQRRGRRHHVAAGARREEGRVRRCRRPPRRRCRANLLGRPARADGVDARDRGRALPGHRLPGRHRRPRRPRVRGQHGPAPRGRRRAVAACVPRDRARRCCARSSRTSSSASTAPTRTRRPARAPVACRSTPSGSRSRPCATCPSSCAGANGWRSAAAATRSSTSFPGSGPTSSRSPGTRTSRSMSRCPSRWLDVRQGPLRHRRAARTWVTVPPSAAGSGGASWESGFDPENSVDRAVMATREAIFPPIGPGHLVRLGDPHKGGGSSLSMPGLRRAAGCCRRGFA